MARFTPPAADAMRARLLLAARDEFAAAGLVGAKIERIAAAASSNKAQIFHYFGSKEGLFDALLAQTVAETFDEVPVDTDDLAEWAARLHDSYVRRPWAERLATWHRLERGVTVRSKPSSPAMPRPSPPSSTPSAPGSCRAATGRRCCWAW
ncbi:TetR family transcriptional regulator [Sphingomonas sp. LR61]|uniref:TetR family transcriptional regulator n=1 Tax=Sphingomonas sp. LR61 TaxID=3050234 RepID=UPI002FE35B17